MRLLLVDDHPVFLMGLSNLLRGRGFDVVGTASDGFAALAQVRALHPDLVLMDIRMARCGGLAATRLISAEFPDVRIVILTASDNEDDLFEALRAGACGYLNKTQDTTSFLSSLADLERGEIALAPGLGRLVLREFSRLSNPDERDADEQNSLSPRQAQILTLVCQGLSYRDIGEHLGLAERTVKYHMGETVAALHVRNRSEAIEYARSHGLADRR